MMWRWTLRRRGCRAKQREVEAEVFVNDRSRLCEEVEQKIEKPQDA
ncbi:hypothetical protein A2U01_0049276, partial [Trifolium medium]|nr:hypothetical protein [Trifolium medium]